MNNTNNVETNEVETNNVETNEVETNNVETNEVETNNVETNEVEKVSDEEKTKLQYLQNYNNILHQLISDLHIAYKDNENITRCYEQKENISCEKHYKYFLRKIEPHVEKLHNNDPSLFSESSNLFLIPSH